LAGEVVDRINDTFGLILLISITHFFVEFIARSFYLVNSISMTNQPDCITLVSMSSESPFSLVHRLQPHQNSPPGSHLLRIYYSEENVGQLVSLFLYLFQAIQVAKLLRKIGSVDNNLQNQVCC
jgi:hypothetical protein